MHNRKLGIIDLTKEKITIREPELELRKKLLGGRGMNVWYLNKMLDKNVDR